MFDHVSYNKGGAILHYIHAMVGDEKFRLALKTYLTANALQPAAASDWQKAVEQATGTDWTQFFKEWYYRGGHPELEYIYQKSDKDLQTKLIVNQKSQPDSGDLYHLEVATQVFYPGSTRGSMVYRFQTTSHTDTFTIPYAGGIAPLLIPDYNYVIPAFFKDNQTLEAQATIMHLPVSYAAKAPRHQHRF